jgi:hypothetical protein
MGRFDAIGGNMQRQARSRAARTLFAVALAVSGAGANAVPFFWTDWTGADLDPGPGFSAQGTITTSTSTVGVTYTNPNGIGFYQPSGGIDYYISVGAGTSPYTSAVVDNRPTGTDIVALSRAGTQTLHFSEAIANPVFAFVSLNGNGYAFDQDFDILSVGGVAGHACGYWGCGGVTKVVVDLGGGKFEYQLNSNNVGGTEPHGTLQFKGAFDTVTWRSLTDEFWNGFTVGVQGTAIEVLPAVPEPESVALIAVGLAALGVMRKRRTRLSASA